MDKKHRQDLGLCGFSLPRYSVNSLPNFIELRMETSCFASHMASVKQQKHLTLSFAIETKNYNSRFVRH